MKGYTDTHDNGNFVWAVVTEKTPSYMVVVGIFDKTEEDKARAAAAQFGVQSYVVRQNLGSLIMNN